MINPLVKQADVALLKNLLATEGLGPREREDVETLLRFLPQRGALTEPERYRVLALSARCGLSVQVPAQPPPKTRPWPPPFRKRNKRKWEVRARFFQGGGCSGR